MRAHFRCVRFGAGISVRMSVCVGMGGDQIVSLWISLALSLFDGDDHDDDDDNDNDFFFVFCSFRI